MYKCIKYVLVTRRPLYVASSLKNYNNDKAHEVSVTVMHGLVITRSRIRCRLQLPFCLYALSILVTHVYCVLFKKIVQQNFKNSKKNNK